MNDILNKLFILRSPGIGPVKYNELIMRFGSVADAAASLNLTDEFMDMVKREMDAAFAIGIQYISDDSHYYPDQLRETKNHPPVITVRGNIETLRQKTIGIVGTRHATATGIRFVSELARDLVDGGGYTIVSGMAIGTDTAAHRGALAVSGDTNTIAVLAGGADYIWPLENDKLYHYIIERGAVVSEMPVGYKPVANNFIQRNRLIAGISEKLILGEADLKSGSMATAGFSCDYGRKVFAIPGHPSDSRSYGPNKLIRNQIATLCMGKNDFIADKSIKPSEENVSEKKDNILLNLLGTNSVSDSVLANMTGQDIGQIKSALVVMELRGLIKKTNTGYIKV